MRLDLLRTIASSQNVTHAIVLTHNIDFVFLQTVVLRTFRKCGDPSITVFADAGCAAESYRHQNPVLDGLGVRYRVVPVAMKQGFRFHPKALFLSSESDATLFVGSGNLTFGGWRENAEVWSRFSASTDGLGPLVAFRRYVERVLDRVPLSGTLQDEISEAFDPSNKSWAENLTNATPNGLLGRMGDGAALLDGMLEACGPDPLSKLLICAPYFDRDAEALRLLQKKTRAFVTTVLCQPARSTLTKEAFAKCDDTVKLQPSWFRHRDGETEREAFLHAKFYGFVRERDVTVLVGSANCSRAALTVAGQDGNAELLAVRHMNLEEFDREYVSELGVDTSSPQLPAAADLPPDEDASSAPLRILAARNDRGRVLVAYAPPETIVTTCEFDGSVVSFELRTRGELTAACSGEPRTLTLAGTLNGSAVRSELFWVDHEHRLGQTAPARGLANALRDKVDPSAWNARAWTDVLDAFAKHLAYLPSRFSKNVQPSRPKDGDAKRFAFTDVFAADYRGPTLAGLRSPSIRTEAGETHSLRKLLLAWFGVPTEDTELEPTTPPEDDGANGPGGEIVDRPERVSIRVPSAPAPKVVTDADRRRIEEVLERIEEAVTTVRFLAERPPSHLAEDLKLTAVLLRVGLREKWISHKRFFASTQRIWSQLFFTGSPELGLGWLEHRMRSAQDPATFVQQLQAPEVTAALLGWMLAVSADDSSIESGRFQLSCVVSVARLPWLWSGSDQGAVERELVKLLLRTEITGTDPAELRERAAAAWSTLLVRGQALYRLQEAIGSTTAAEFSARIGLGMLLAAGDILWQGSAGLCVVLRDCPRAAENIVEALPILSAEPSKRFQAQSTVPLRALLDGTMVPDSESFGQAQKSALLALVETLRGEFQNASKRS